MSLIEEENHSLQEKVLALQEHNAIIQGEVFSTREEKTSLIEERNKLLLIIEEHEDALDVYENESNCLLKNYKTKEKNVVR